MKAHDPLGWRGASAPSLAQFEVLAIEAFRRLPEQFRALCADLVIKIDDFATDEVLDHLGARSEFDVLGLFQGVGLPFRSESAPVIAAIITALRMKRPHDLPLRSRIIGAPSTA